MVHFAQRLKRAFLDDERPVVGDQNDGQAARTISEINLDGSKAQARI